MANWILAKLLLLFLSFLVQIQAFVALTPRRISLQKSSSIMTATNKAAVSGDDGEEEGASFMKQLESFFGGPGTKDIAKTKEEEKKGEDSSKDTEPKDDATPFYRRVIQKIRQTPFLPAIATFWVGYRVGLWRQTAVRAVADTASRGYSSSVRDSLRTWALTLALVSLLVREFWRGIPIWLKRQIPRLVLPQSIWKRLVPDSGKNISDDSGSMTSLPTIIKKLKSLFALATEKLGLQDQESTENIESSMLVLLRLVRQVKEHRPDIRDAEFKSDEQEEATINTYHQKMFEFADAAYNELPNEQALRDFLEEMYGFELLRHDADVVPGSVAHYIAVNRATKEAIIGVKGTSSLEDVLTDCCGVGVDYEGMRCHDGILTASKRLAEDLETVLVDLLIPRGYSVTLTGHSLGAGVAALAGILLRKHTDKLKVLAFASPPILDYQSAQDCEDFVTTVVNKADVIPRSSLANLAVLKTLLVESIRPRLKERGIIPSDFQSAKALLQYMSKKVDSETDESQWIMTAEEAKEALRKALEKVPVKDKEHLYIPGKVLFLYQLWDNPDKKKAHGVKHMKPTDHVLRHLELDLSMVSDHLAPSYRETISELVEPSEDNAEANDKEKQEVESS